MDIKQELITGELEFHFHKSNFFRVVHVDGAFGGVSPGTGTINMAVYSERAPIPKSITHAVVDGIVGAENLSKRSALTGIFREVETDLVMSMEVAVVIRDWLDARIKELAAARQIGQPQ